MRIEDLIREKREEILRIAAKHGAINVRLFGSVARGETGPESDVDLLVEEGPETSDWFPGGLITDLESLLGRDVDVVPERWMNPTLRPYIVPEAIPLDQPLPAIRRRRTKMKKDDRVYLDHIAESIRKVQDFTASGREAFFDSALVQDATLRNLQTIAGSTQKLSPEFKARHTNVTWGQLAGFRNRLTHDYLSGIDLEQVWDAIQNTLPDLKRVVAAALDR
jgi:uncharacterized protein with HEPN domain/predicted nucleotidyltransferase